MDTWTALLIVLAGATPCLFLAAVRAWRIWRRRRALLLANSTVNAGCEHLTVSAGGAFTSFSCGQCGPLPVVRFYRWTATR